MPTSVSGSHFKLNLTTHATLNRIHAQGVRYSEVQNNRESLVSCWRRNGSTESTSSSSIGFDSFLHSAVPSSLMWFHHRFPTNRRPVTFFTVRKSHA